MNRITCPFLGLKDDSTTTLAFPSDGNFCHHARPVAPVNRKFQQQYCLSGEHIQCPIFLAEHPLPLPAVMLAPAPPRMNSRRVVTMLAIPALLAGTTALVLTWNSLGGWFGIGSSIRVNTASGPGEWALLDSGLQNAPLPTAEPTPTTFSDGTVTNNPFPGGWTQDGAIPIPTNTPFPSYPAATPQPGNNSQASPAIQAPKPTAQHTIQTSVPVPPEPIRVSTGQNHDGNKPGLGKGNGNKHGKKKGK